MRNGVKCAFAFVTPKSIIMTSVEIPKVNAIVLRYVLLKSVQIFNFK